jgi:hypothetical protein
VNNVLADEKEMKRERYLEAFFGALGEKSFVINSACPERIGGTVLYDEQEKQDFCWVITEEQVPSESAYLLLKLLQEQRLIDVDRIIVPREELQQRYAQMWGTITTVEEFARILDEIEDVEVAMIDDGEEIDAFLIHE